MWGQSETSLAPIIAAHGPVDILVNNAATVTRRAKITELRPDEWERALSVNLTGAFSLEIGYPTNVRQWRWSDFEHRITTGSRGG